MVFIIQQLNGPEQSKSRKTLPSLYDQGASQIRARSLFVMVNAEGQLLPKPKDSDDKIVIGFTEHYMMFQIVVDGFFGCDREEVFSFIDKHVVSRMDDYCRELSVKDNPDGVTKSLIRGIYEAHALYAQNADFTLSVAMTFMWDDVMHCAGFGIGDTGIVLKRARGTIVQLVHSAEVDGFKDAFDAHSGKNIELVIQRNSVFHTFINPGDEIIGYTYLPPALRTESSNQVVAQSVENVKHFAVQQLEIKPQDSFFDALMHAIENAHKDSVRSRLLAAQPMYFGDDFMMGRMIVPDQEQRMQFQCRRMLHLMMRSLMQFIDVEYKRVVTGTFALFCSKANLEKADCYKVYIEKNAEDLLLCMLAFKDLVRTNVSLSGLIHKQLTIPEDQRTETFITNVAKNYYAATCAKRNRDVDPSHFNDLLEQIKTETEGDRSVFNL